MAHALSQKKFGTAPVFFTAISTILGAIMFLRFGYAVGNVGFLGTIGIILIGHAVTIPTAMAIAEIATNQKVEGGGEYYIISRSFGRVIGTSIGITLYLSQAISVAFYIMAFTEAFTPLFNYLEQTFNLPRQLIWLMHQKQTIGIPALLVLTYVMLTRGASLGIKMLYVVVATLAISLAAFFAGNTEYAGSHAFDPLATVAQVQEAAPADGPETGQGLSEYYPFVPYRDTVESPAEHSVSPENGPSDTLPASTLIPVGFFTIFAIIFPAFTGMTAGVGLSGDLRDPGKSIPLGTMSATLIGMVVYGLLAWKLANSASPADLADTSSLVMADIAWQGWWIIPLGLAAATISSALGSIMVAPRTLQAIARDHTLPLARANNWLSRGKGASDEPYNASVVTILLAAAFIMAGALDSVAQVISMFFMVTYGTLCLISFLNHFAADPSYRPKFRSRWFVSLFGAVACFGLMFFMNAPYALLAIVLMGLLHFVIARYNRDKRSMALIFQNVIFQFSRRLQVFLQKAEKEQSRSWRPSAVALSPHTFERIGLFDLLRWISQKYGFGTYIHHIEGYLSRDTNLQAVEARDRIIQMTELAGSNIYIDTLINPSFTASIAQVIQLPGIAGTENNLLMFEFARNHPKSAMDLVDNYNLIKSVDFDVLLLGSAERGFGLKRNIHIWITSADYQHANLMILTAYIILGHREWKGGEIKIFAVFPEDGIENQRKRLENLIQMGQLPISPNNVRFIAREADKRTESIIAEVSRDADLTILGFHPERLKREGVEAFQELEPVGNILFVNAVDSKAIK